MTILDLFNLFRPKFLAPLLGASPLLGIFISLGVLVVGIIFVKKNKVDDTKRISLKRIIGFVLVIFGIFYLVLFILETLISNISISIL